MALVSTYTFFSVHSIISYALRPQYRQYTVNSSMMQVNSGNYKPCRLSQVRGTKVAMQLVSVRNYRKWRIRWRTAGLMQDKDIYINIYPIPAKLPPKETGHQVKKTINI